MTHNPIAPDVNINGTSKGELLRQLDQAVATLRSARISRWWPRGRMDGITRHSGITARSQTNGCHG